MKQARLDRLKFVSSRKKSILIDTSLIILLIVGLHNKNNIGKKITAKYYPEDFEQLRDIIYRFDEIWITSHCFAEASNLLHNRGYKRDRSGVNYLTYLKELVGKFEENHVKKEAILNDSGFTYLGVADTGFMQTARKMDCCLVDDAQLYYELYKVHPNPVNFTQHRESLQ